MRTNARRVAVIATVAALVVSGAPDAGTPDAEAAPPIGEALVGTLPTGARQLLAGLRIIDGLGTRNRVYREAHHVQRELRTYYDARIETAQRQLADREQLGLRDSQVQAYTRVVTTLRAEREAAIQLTEDEKRAAKYAFEGRLRKELLGAVARSPKGQQALKGIRGVVSDVRDRFGQIQAAIEGGNPINVLVSDLQGVADKLRTAGAAMSLLSGKVGSDLGRKADAVQGLIDRIGGATDEAAAVGQQAIDTLDGALDSLDGQIESPRRARAASDLLSEAAIQAALDAIFAPGGETPDTDVVADAIARGFDRDLVENVGVALGEIDPTDLATMRERVRAAILSSTIKRIADRCGRLTGALRRDALEALEQSTAAPDAVPCALFRNPEKLQDFIRNYGSTRESTTTLTAPSTTTTSTTVPEPPPDTGAIAGEVRLSDQEVCELIPAYPSGYSGLPGNYEVGMALEALGEANCLYGVLLSDADNLRISIAVFESAAAARDKFNREPTDESTPGGVGPATPLDIGDDANHWSWIQPSDCCGDASLSITKVVFGPFLIIVSGNGPGIDGISVAGEVAANIGDAIAAGLTG